VKPYYEDGSVTIFHGDCREVLPDIEAEVLVSDPPYGMNLNTDYSGIDRGRGRKYERIAEDDQPFDPTEWLDYPVGHQNRGSAVGSTPSATSVPFIQLHSKQAHWTFS